MGVPAPGLVRLAPAPPPGGHAARGHAVGPGGLVPCRLGRPHRRPLRREARGAGSGAGAARRERLRLRRHRVPEPGPRPGRGLPRPRRPPLRDRQVRDGVEPECLGGRPSPRRAGPARWTWRCATATCSASSATSRATPLPQLLTPSQTRHVLFHGSVAAQQDFDPGHLFVQRPRTRRMAAFFEAGRGDRSRSRLGHLLARLAARSGIHTAGRRCPDRTTSWCGASRSTRRSTSSGRASCGRVSRGA